VGCAGAVTAASIPIGTGAGWVISGVAGTLALIVGARLGARTPDDRPRIRIDIARWAWTGATLALLSVGTIRAAPWLFVLCLLTSGVTASLAVAGGSSVRALLLATLLPPLATLRAIPWAARGLARRRRGGTAAGRIAGAVGVSVVLLVVFGTLFASADAAFAELLGRALPEVRPDAVARLLFLFPVAAAGLLGAALLLAAPADLTGLESPPTRRVRRLEWVMPLALLDALFASFVLVQVTVLFGGSDHVLRTAGLTFAEYARRGFWQLLAVTALTLLVLAATVRWAPRDTRADRALIRTLLGALAVLSLVVVASALYRMNVYEGAYGFTRLRILVSACELWLGLVFALVLAAGVRLRATWLPRLVVGSAVLALLGLAAINPDRVIAERNVDRYLTRSGLDVAYLARLSADAAPALNRLPPALRDCALAQIADDLARHPDGWREANLGRTSARRVLAADPVFVPPSNCPTAAWPR